MLNVIESMSDLKANVVSIGAILEQIEKLILVILNYVQSIVIILLIVKSF